MRILRYIAFALGGIAAVLLAIGLFLYATFDATRAKAEVQRIVKEKKQRTLSLDGELALAFWPSVGVRLGPTRLSERNGERDFAAIDSAHVTLAVLPLMAKHVVIERLDVQGLNATIVRGKDGKLSIDDLIASDNQEESGAQFDIDAIRMAGAQLVLRDEAAGREIRLSEARLETGRVGKLAVGRLGFAGKLAVDQPAVALDLSAQGEYGLALERKEVSLGTLEVRAHGDAAALKKLDATLTAAGLKLRTDAGALEADKLALSARGEAGENRIEAQLAAPKLLAGGERTSGESVKLDLRLAGKSRSGEAHAEFAGLQGSGRALQALLNLRVDAREGANTFKGSASSPLAANLDTMTFDLSALAMEIEAKAGEAALRGRIDTPLALRVRESVIDAPKLHADLTLAHPALAAKSLRVPLDASAHIDQARDTAEAKLDAHVDETTLRARVNLPKLSPPALRFEADIDRLNVDRYLPPKADDKPQPDKPIDLSALQDVDAAGTVRIGALQVSNVKLANVKFELKAAGGALEIAPHSANLYDGALAGSFSIHAHGNRVALKETLTNVDINALLRDAAKKDMLEGRGNLSLDITTAGETAGHMKRALDGSARLALRNGAVKGINLARTLREVKSNFAARQDATRKPVASEKTDFSEMTASFKLARGVAHNDDLAVKSPFLRLGGAGDIDLAGARIDYLARATLVSTPAGEGGKELAELRGVSVPVRLAGPFDGPEYKLEFASLAQDLARARLDAAKGELAQQARNKLQQQLGRPLAQPLAQPLQQQLKGLVPR